MIKIAVLEVGPIFLVVCRCTIGAALMLAIISVIRSAQWPDNRRDWIWLVLTGIISTAVPFMLIAFAEQKITSSMTGMLMTVSPMVAILMGHFMTDDEKINRGKMIGILIGFVATVWLLRAGVDGLGGAGIIYPLSVIIASICYATGGLMAKKLPRITSEVIAAVVLVSSSAFMLPILLMSGTTPEFSGISTEAWLALLWLGLMPSGVAFYLRYLLIKRAGYGFVSYVGYLIPVFAILIGNTWLDEVIMPETVMAMSIIILGLFLTRGAGDFPWTLTSRLTAFRKGLN